MDTIFRSRTSKNRINISSSSHQYTFDSIHTCQMNAQLSSVFILSKFIATNMYPVRRTMEDVNSALNYRLSRPLKIWIFILSFSENFHPVIKRITFLHFQSAHILFNLHDVKTILCNLHFPLQQPLLPLPSLSFSLTPSHSCTQNKFVFLTL